MQEAHVKGRGRFAVFMAVVLAVGGLVAGQLARLTTNADGGQDETQVVSFSFDGDNAGKIILNGYTEAVPDWDYSLDYTLDGESVWVSGENQTEHQLSDEEVASITAEKDIVVRVLLEDEVDETTPPESTDEPIGADTDTDEKVESGTELEDAESDNLDNMDSIPAEPEYLYYTIDIEEQSLPGTFAADDEDNCFVGVEDLVGMLEWRIGEDSDWMLYDEGNLPDLTGNVSVQVRLRSMGTKLASQPQTFEFTEDEQSGGDKDPDGGDGDDKDPDDSNDDDGELGNGDKEPGDGDDSDGEKPGDGDDDSDKNDPDGDGSGTTTPEKPGGSTEPADPDGSGDPVKPSNPADSNNPGNSSGQDQVTKPDGDNSTTNNGTMTDIPVELPKTGANSIQQTQCLLVAGVGATLVLASGEVVAAKRRK